MLRVCARHVVPEANVLIKALDSAADKMPGGMADVRDVCEAYFDILFPENSDSEECKNSDSEECKNSDPKEYTPGVQKSISYSL